VAVSASGLTVRTNSPVCALLRVRSALADVHSGCYNSHCKPWYGVQFAVKQFVSQGALSLAAVALFTAAAFSQARFTGDAAVLADGITALQGAAAPLHVTSSSFTPSPRDTTPGTLNARFTADRENISPSLSWSRGPAGTLSYAVLMEGVDVVDGHPVTHWVIYNIPSTVLTLPERVPAEMHLENGALKGAMQIKLRGSAGYYGPHVPSGATRWYHFEVFALDTHLNLDPATADRTAIVNAMKRHVLTSGEVITNSTGR
jgi:Raf kinase inhibitor-like YbhB/YbcL family protein